MQGQLCNHLSPSSTSSIDKPSKPVGPCCSIWLFHSPNTFFNSDIMPQKKKEFNDLRYSIFDRWLEEMTFLLDGSSEHVDMLEAHCLFQVWKSWGSRAAP
jgi:hypothetical protein